MSEHKEACGLKLSKDCKGFGRIYSCLLGKSCCEVCYEKYWENKVVGKVVRPSSKKETLYYHPS